MFKIIKIFLSITIAVLCSSYSSLNSMAINQIGFIDITTLNMNILETIQNDDCNTFIKFTVDFEDKCKTWFPGCDYSTADILAILIHPQTKGSIAHIAAAYNSLEILSFLKSIDYNFNDIGGSLHLPIYAIRHPTTLDWFVSNNIPFDVKTPQGITPLLLSAYLGYNDVVMHYLNHYHANIHEKDNDGYGILAYAAMGNKIILVQDLMNKKRLTIMADEPNILDYAGIKSIPAILELIGIEYRCTKLHQTFLYACGTGMINKVKYLFAEYEIPINTIDPSGHNALSLAIDYKQGDIIRFLLSRGAQLPQKDQPTQINTFNSIFLKKLFS